MLAQCGARAIVFDAELVDRVPDGEEVPSLRWRIFSSAAESAPSWSVSSAAISARARAIPASASTSSSVTSPAT